MMATFSSKTSPESLGGRKVAVTIAFERRLIARCVRTLGPAGRILLSDQLMDGESVVLALHPDPIELAEHKATLDFRRRARTDDDGAPVVFWHAFEPGGDVHSL